MRKKKLQEEVAKPTFTVPVTTERPVQATNRHKQFSVPFLCMNFSVWIYIFKN
jgi:hypothetical protein